MELIFWIALILGLAQGDDNEEAPVEPDEPEPPPENDDQPYVPQPGLSPLWPLPRSRRRWRPSSFGQARPFGSSKPTRAHEGIDIRAKEGDPVLAPTDGTVIGVQGWDGPNTRGLLFQSWGGPVLVFGAVKPGSYPKPGTPAATVKRGEKIAEIGRYPGGSTMLHFEVWKVGTTKRKPWPWRPTQAERDAVRPAALVNPQKYLAATVDT